MKNFFVMERNIIIYYNNHPDKIYSTEHLIFIILLKELYMILMEINFMKVNL